MVSWKIKLPVCPTFAAMGVSRPSLGLSGSDEGRDPADAEVMARISVSLPRSLYRRFRLHALEQDTTLSALMVRLIRQEINSRT